MAPKTLSIDFIEIAKEHRQAIVKKLQEAIDIKYQLSGGIRDSFDSISTSIRRDDMAYVTEHVIPNLRKLLQDGDGQPISDTIQLIGHLDIEGKCICSYALCRCAIRRTLKITIQKRQVFDHIQDANANQ